MKKKTDEIRGEYATEKEDSLNNARAMIGWDKPVEIVDDSDLRKYRIELPNLYDDAGLDPYEFRLLAHYKRVGKCTEGTRTTAGICKMSPMQVSVKRKSLHQKGFIVMKEVPLKGGGYSFKITVVDRWQENFLKYGARTQDVHPRTPHEVKESDDEEAISKIAKAYESEIGIITPMIADDIQDTVKTYPLKWILDAIHEAAVQNKRGWKYCLAILKRWKAQGNQEPANKPATTPTSYIPDMGDLEKQYGF